MRKVLMLTALIAMIATGAMAAKLPSKSAPATMAYNHDMGRSISEGFEGAFPPAGWYHGITNPANTWYQDSISPFEGVYAARIGWQAGIPQDEVLSFDYLVVSGDDLTFETMGSAYWSAFGNFTCEIDGAVVYDFNLEEVNNFVWAEIQIDLEVYAGSMINIAFRYVGDDGADHHLDAIQVGAYTPPPPPPAVTFCADVIDASGTGMFYGDTCDGVNLISALGCEAYTENGFEDYYEIVMPAGSSFTATVTNTADGALWVVAECEADGGAFTCLGYADATFGGDPEVVSYTNTGGDTVVYLVVDSWGTDSCGTYDMNFESVGGAVANEDMSMGAVKALFR